MATKTKSDPVGNAVVNSNKVDKKPAMLRVAKSVLVEDLRVGDRIVTSFHKGLASMTAKEQELALKDFEKLGGQRQFVNRSFEIKEISECAGMWRTHVHIGSGCYDIRTSVHIVDFDEPAVK